MATVKKQGSGYKITVSCGYDMSGKQVRKHMTWVPDVGMTARQEAKELQRQAVLFEDSCKQGIGFGGHIKFEAFLQKYFDEYATNNLRERTRSGYEAYLPRVTKALGHLYLDKITPRQIKSFILNLGEDGINQKTGGGLSPKSIKNYLGFLSSVFGYALELEMINTNPCNSITPPAKEYHKKDGYTLDEAQDILDSLLDAPTKYRTYITLAIFCGYRREELCGLEWRDIDFSKSTIAINRALLYTKQKGVYIDDTKTVAGKRVQKQSDAVFNVLHKWRMEQNEMRIACGDLWVDEDRVFSGELGGSMHPNTPYSWFRRHCASHGIRFLGLHALRHLNASLRIYAGADVTTVAAALGHAQASTTLNIYAYEFAQAQAASSDAVADLLANKHQTNT